MSWSRRIRRNTLKALALGFAAASVFTAGASGMNNAGGSDSTASEIPYLSHGYGITHHVASNGGVMSKSLIEEHLAREARDAERAGFGVTRGGVTPTDLARAYVPNGDRVVGVSKPDGYQPQLRGDEPIVIRGAPDGYQPQTRGVEPVSVASGGSIDWSEFAVGFGLGLFIAGLCTLMLLDVRGRGRTASA